MSREINKNHRMHKERREILIIDITLFPSMIAFISDLYNFFTLLCENKLIEILNKEYKLWEIFDLKV